MLLAFCLPAFCLSVCLSACLSPAGDSTNAVGVEAACRPAVLRLFVLDAAARVGLWLGQRQGQRREGRGCGGPRVHTRTHTREADVLRRGQHVRLAGRRVSCVGGRGSCVAVQRAARRAWARAGAAGTTRQTGCGRQERLVLEQRGRRRWRRWTRWDIGNYRRTGEGCPLRSGVRQSHPPSTRRAAAAAAHPLTGNPPPRKRSQRPGGHGTRPLYCFWRQRRGTAGDRRAMTGARG